ncbi:MAG TPA: hypothetical protein VNH38_03305 [Candidatus Dormibacteraeota bacterium]|nr:hypothetical protein [Candidatus Dormibacteraeota bacterium]
MPEAAVTVLTAPPRVVFGASNEVVYSVTLASGILVTNPEIWPELISGLIEYDEAPEWAASDAERVRRRSADVVMVEGLENAPWDDELYDAAERARVEGAVAEADRLGWVPLGTIEPEHGPS